MINLDSNAITSVFPEILEGIINLMKEFPFLNPSSVHSEGKKAKRILEQAKAEITESLKAKCHEIYFTSGGTESNNMALNFQEFDYIFTLQTEHDSILKPLSKLKHKFIKIDKNGIADLEDLRKQIKNLGSSNFLCSVMMANNETGVLQDIKKIAEIVHENGGLLHSDVCQFIGKKYFSFSEFDIDVLTLSGNKIHSGFGGGLIIFKSGLDIKPFILGGGQQNFKRGGTENIPQIFALSKSIIKVNSKEYITEYISHTSLLQKKLEEAVILNGGLIFASEISRISNTSLIFMPNVNNFIQVMEFDLNGICISSGSACSSGKTDVSHVLKACGVPEKEAKNFIRISTSKFNTLAEIEKFIEAWNGLKERKI